MKNILDSEIPNLLSVAVRDERLKTSEVLRLINLSLDRKVYLREGYPSMFAWLVKGFGYSESSAYRRIEAARVLRVVPDVGRKLEEGEINLAHLTRANSVFKAQERLDKREISAAEKARVLDEIQGKSRIESEKTLFELYPETASEVRTDRVVVVNQNTTRLSVDLPDEVMADLNRARDLLASVYPHGNFADVIGRVVKEYLARKDPLRYEPRARKSDHKTAPRFRGEEELRQEDVVH